MKVYVATELDYSGGYYTVGVYSTKELAAKANRAHMESEQYDGGQLNVHECDMDEAGSSVLEVES